MREPWHLPSDRIEEAGVLIADFIDDVMLAHKAMWAEYRRQQAQ